MDTITIKRGDTLQFSCSYKDTNSTPIDLSTFIITVSVINDSDITVVEISSTDNTPLRTISTGTLDVGTFSVVMKDTEILTEDVYFVDIKYTTVSGIETTSKAFKLNVKSKLV